MLARVFPDSGTLRRIREQRFDTGATVGSRGLRQTQQKRLRLETSSREAALISRPLPIPHRSRTHGKRYQTDSAEWTKPGNEPPRRVPGSEQECQGINLSRSVRPA
jgi:hypothetical protein